MDKRDKGERNGTFKCGGLHPTTVTDGKNLVGIYSK